MKRKLRAWFKFSWRDTIAMVVILTMATVLCFFLRIYDEGNDYVSMIFILMVFLIATTTEGYAYGIISSCIGVLLVNFFFTYPFFHFNFTLAGYPLTILSMLVVSIATSTLTTKAKFSAQAHLETEREKTRANLLRAISHDLRTPLTGILGASSAILEHDNSLTAQDRLGLVQDIQNDAQWLIRMVENLLTITRMDDQDAKVVKTAEPGEEILEASVLKFKKQHPDWKVTVSMPEELLMIPMDAVLMEQVLMNLMENVVDHGKGADRIWACLSRERSMGVFTVRDNGCGIDPAVLPQIFAGTMSASYGKSGDRKRNMGIGLSVCFTIVQAHNGTLEANNVKEGGAQFRIALPLEEDIDE